MTYIRDDDYLLDETVAHPPGCFCRRCLRDQADDVRFEEDEDHIERGRE